MPSLQSETVNDRLERMTTLTEVKPPKALGLWTLTSLVAGNMIGSGIFLLPSSLAAFGTIGIAAWGITTLGTLFLALVFARLARALPRTGGPYVFCHEAYGDFMGFQVAYNYWIALWVGNAAISVAFVGYLSVFWPILKMRPLWALAVCLSSVWLITLVNIWGIRQAGRLQLITTILKLIPLFLIATVGLVFIKVENLTQFNISGQSNFSALTAAATLTMWSFIGFESATVPADNVINPRKNIPRATIIGTLIAAAVYILSTISVMGAVPMAELAKSASPFADAAGMMLGSNAALIIAAAGAIACFGTLNGWVLMQGQIPLAAARDGLFPDVFARLNRSGTPIVGLVVSSILITGLFILQYGVSIGALFSQIITLATLASLIPYIFTSVAEVILMYRDPKRYHKKHFRSAVILASLGFTYSFWAIWGAGTTTIALGMMLFLSGIPFYILMKRRDFHKNGVTVVTE